jgi:Tfp pilus assembly PilM family ATPase
MAKPRRKNPLPKPGFSVGLEYDHLAIRGARLSSDGRGGIAVDHLEEVRGDYAEDTGLIDGLKKIKEKLGMTPRDSVVACLSGKQVFASQLAFRNLPREEMEPALRLELRKSMHFDVTGSALDYQVLSQGDVSAVSSDNVQVLVALVGGGLLPRQLKALEKAGIKPAAVDVLPVALSNAIWSWVDKPREQPHVAVHIGPAVSTVVIDGLRSPFFNRSVYFSAEEVFGKDPAAAAIDRRLAALGDEIARSLTFYEKSAFASGFTEILLLGDYLETTPLTEHLRKYTGIPVRRMDLPKKLGGGKTAEAGRFDLAVTLAMRGDE